MLRAPKSHWIAMSLVCLLATPAGADLGTPTWDVGDIDLVHQQIPDPQWECQQNQPLGAASMTATPRVPGCICSNNGTSTEQQEVQTWTQSVCGTLISGYENAYTTDVFDRKHPVVDSQIVTQWTLRVCYDSSTGLVTHWCEYDEVSTVPHFDCDLCTT